MSNNSPLNQYYAYCLQGNIPKAIKLVQKINSRSLISHQRFKKRVIRRFIKKTEALIIKTKDPILREIIKAYRIYFRDSLLNKKNHTKFEKRLFKELSDILIKSKQRKIKVKNWKQLEKIIKAKFLKRGSQVILGKVFPYRSLIAWKKQSSKKYKIHLPSTTENIEVIMLENFVELGWMHYATFGRYYVGGWASKKEIFCVKKAWKLKSDQFKVSFLAHEAQHFNDYKHFPKLSSADLEFRAKLVELIYSKQPLQTFKKFQQEAAPQKEVPHAFAAYSILLEISKATGISFSKIKSGRFSAKGAKLAQISKDLFLSHTELLKSKGKKRVKSVL